MNAIEDEREAFEKAMEANLLDLSRTDTQTYCNGTIRIAWAAWQRRADISSKEMARHLRAGARSALLDPIGSARSVNEYAKQDGQPRLSAAENALDAVRLSWLSDHLWSLDKASSDPPQCVIAFLWPVTARVSTDLRLSIDEAMNAASGTQAKETP